MLIERRSNSTTSLHVGGTRKYSFEFCIENCKNASETIDFNRGYIIYFKNGNVVIILCSIQIMQYQGQMTNYNIIKVTYSTSILLLVLQWMLLFGVSCCTFESGQYHTGTFCFQKNEKKIITAMICKNRSQEIICDVVSYYAKKLIVFEANLNQCVDIVVVQVTKNYFNARVQSTQCSSKQGDASLVTHLEGPHCSGSSVPLCRRTPELKVTKIRSIIALSTTYHQYIMVILVLEAPKQLMNLSFQNIQICCLLFNF